MKPFRRSIPPQCIPLLLCATPAFAQKPDSARAAPPFALDSIVVTATRVPIAAVTAATTVVNGASLRARGITHVVDALREVPGVSVTRAGSIGGQTTVRIRGGETGYVRVMIDGVALNQPGGDFDFANLTTEDVDRIEVVRGPASVLYGTDAVTGVIQIFTRTGSGPASVSAGVRAGTEGTSSLDSRFAGRTGPAAYSFTLSRYATDGIYAFNNAYRHTVLGGSLQLAADERTDLRVTLHHADDEYHTPTDGSGNVVDRNAVQSARRFDLGIDVSRALSPRLDARLALAASGSDGGFDDAADGPADTLGFFGYRSIDDIQRRSVDARVDYRAAEGVVLTGGGQIEQKFQHSLDETLSEFGPSTGSFDAERWSRALFAQALVARSGLALNAGARVDGNDAFGTFATFRAGAAYRLPTGTRARVAVGNAFREPTFFQNFATGFVIGNPDLEPELTRTC
jgi:vitamin B12 transporter